MAKNNPKTALAVNPSTQVTAMAAKPKTHKNAQGQWVDEQGRRVDGYGRPLKGLPNGGNKGGKGGTGGGNTGNKPVKPPPQPGDILTKVPDFYKENYENQMNDLARSSGTLGQQAMIRAMNYDPNNPMANWDPTFAQYAQKAQQSVMDQFNRSQEPQFAREDADFQQRMAEQGIDPNSGRYKTEYQNLQQAHNNARQNAMDQAYTTGLGAQQQAFNQNYNAQQLPAEFAKTFMNYQQTPYLTNAELQKANIGANAQMTSAAMSAIAGQPGYVPPNPWATGIGSLLNSAGQVVSGLNKKE
jgi:hypothetical protein